MIGVFDSGLGGLSVLAALVEALPQADFVYYADTAHVPYGNKSEAQIQRRVLAIGEHLANEGCRLQLAGPSALFTGQLIETWQRAIYGGLQPPTATVHELCGQFDARLAPGARA